MVSSSIRYICDKCSKVYKVYSWFIKHKCKTKKITDYKKSKSKYEILAKKLKYVKHDHSIVNNNLMPWLNVYNFTDEYFNEDNTYLEATHNTSIYSDELTEFVKASDNDLKIVHLNINSLYIKIDEIHDLLDKKEFDLMFLNETKLDSSVPNSKVSHHAYNMHRRDRDYSESVGLGRHGGGLIVYSKKYLNCSVSLSKNFEALKLKLKKNK